MDETTQPCGRPSFRSLKITEGVNPKPAPATHNAQDPGSHKDSVVISNACGAGLLPAMKLGALRTPAATTHDWQGCGHRGPNHFGNTVVENAYSVKSTYPLASYVYICAIKNSIIIN